MKFRPKLPHSVPESLKLKPKEHSPLVKAKAHEHKAEKLRDDEDASAHLEYLERFKALTEAVKSIDAKARHEWKGLLGVEEMKPHEVLGHMIGTLPRARMDVLFKDERIAALNVALSHRNLNKLIGDNELLEDWGITPATFLSAKRDLKFQLGLQTYKSAQALALYLTMIRAAADPKVKKTVNFVKDEEILDLANGILREVTTHVVQEMQLTQDGFLMVGDRRAVAEQERQARVKKSGRPDPLAQKPAAKPAPGAAAPKASKPPPGGLRG